LTSDNHPVLCPALPIKSKEVLDIGSCGDDLSIILGRQPTLWAKPLDTGKNQKVPT
jgi:hypothetical protein